MIVIQHIALDKNITLQTIRVKGVLTVLGIHVPEKDKPYATVIVNTSENIVRAVELVLLTEGADAAAILYNPKYKGSENGYYLFEKQIRPQPR
jgi:hypothetical protein